MGMKGTEVMGHMLLITRVFITKTRMRFMRDMRSRKGVTIWNRRSMMSSESGMASFNKSSATSRRSTRGSRRLRCSHVGQSLDVMAWDVLLTMRFM